MYKYIYFYKLPGTSEMAFSDYASFFLPLLFSGKFNGKRDGRARFEKITLQRNYWPNRVEIINACFFLFLLFLLSEFFRRKRKHRTYTCMQTRVIIIIINGRHITTRTSTSFLAALSHHHVVAMCITYTHVPMILHHVFLLYIFFYFMSRTWKSQRRARRYETRGFNAISVLRLHRCRITAKKKEQNATSNNNYSLPYKNSKTSLFFFLRCSIVR